MFADSNFDLSKVEYINKSIHPCFSIHRRNQNFNNFIISNLGNNSNAIAENKFFEVEVFWLDIIKKKSNYNEMIMLTQNTQIYPAKALLNRR